MAPRSSGWGARGPGRERGEGQRSLPRGGAAGSRARGWCPQGGELCSGYWGLRHSRRWMHHDYPSYTNQEISTTSWSLPAFIFSPAQTGSNPWRGDSINKLGVKSRLHVYMHALNLHALSSGLFLLLSAHLF